MVLDEFLFPREKVIFKCEKHVGYKEERYEFHLTKLRMILYREYGFIFKKEEVISINLPEVVEISYRERGLRKRGFLDIRADRHYLLEGLPNDMRDIWKELRSRGVGLPQVSASSQQIMKEKEIITKEIVMIACKHCGSLMPQTSVFCPECGARRKG